MGSEIERKFLVPDGSWQMAAARRGPGIRLRQGYLASGGGGGRGATVRIRLAEDRGFLTVKGPGLLVRAEYEYAIPAADAAAMLASLCPPPILEKTRHEIEHQGLLWHVDAFGGHLLGLVLAEVEIPSPDHPVPLPPWVGREVTEDPRYGNAALAAAAGPP